MTLRRTLNLSARSLVPLLWLGIFAAGAAWSQVNVWTHRYDNARTGANLAEGQLSTSTVNAAQFGKLFSYAVDADIYTQPLVMGSVAIPGKGTHNVVYVATNNNSVYAFDADTNQGANSAPLWKVSFNGPAVTPVPSSDVGTLNNIRTPGSVGVMGTPVIDQSTGTMYLVARTKETAGGNTLYLQRLHALDISSGAEKFGGPVIIQASVPGSGYDSVTGTVSFNPLKQNQRAGLGLANGNVYIVWASHEDSDPYHGWIMAYSASTLQQVGAFCVTPDGTRGGIWQSGQPVSFDASGNVYVATGNGDFNGTRNFGQSVIKLNSNLSLLDWFTPDNWSTLNFLDLDLGSAGLLLIPGTTELVAAGKEGRIYVVNESSLGHTQVGNGQIVQTFQVTSSGGNIHGAPAYWNTPSGPWAYVWGEVDFLKAFAFNGSTFNSTPISQSTYKAPPGMPGGFLTISANGSQAGSGILWASVPYAEDAEAEVVSGVLRAFNAADLTQELWNTRMIPGRDDLGNFAKFVPPTVANGRVYVASFSNRLHVYGLLASLTPPTGGVIAGSGAASSVSVDLTAEGPSDWARWPGYDGNASGNEQISDFAFLGATPSTYNNDPRTISWTDGTETVCGSSTQGVSVSGTNNGFLVTVPADTSFRTLKLYVGGTNSRGMLTAHLSDGSAPDFVDTGFSSTGQYDVVYTLNYVAAAAGQQLNVMWTLFSGTGNVTLQAAAIPGASGKTPAGCGVWVEDALPSGASLVLDHETFEWVSGYPAPYSGMFAHQSALVAGEHQHGFVNATATLAVGVGDTLFTYVYLDPTNPPSEVMLQWNNGSWSSRAYWGTNQIAFGVDGTNSRRYMGALPPTGQWVQLTVPASQVGLEGSTLNGMAFTLYNGRATWDYAGKISSGQPPTTTTLTSSVNPSVVGASVTFTATVTGAAPTGSVAFTDGGTTITGCGSVALPAGAANAKVATCGTTSLSAATHNIVATYAGDATNNGSVSTTLSQVVNKGTSTTGLASSVNPSTAGVSVTFTATVSGSAPIGAVAFTDGGTMITGCAAVALPAGAANSKVATCTTSSLIAATHNIVATYTGDATNNGSVSTTLSQVVNPGPPTPTTTTLTSSTNPSVVGTSVTFTATITGTAPTGTVAFTDGGTTIAGCGSVALPAGAANAKVATCSTSSLSATTHSIVANYGGDTANNGSSSTPLSQAVNKTLSTTGVASSLNPSTAGLSVTFTATVAANAPTGAVAFTDGGTTIAGCGAVALAGSGNSKTAACSTSSMTVATHSIVAAYSGDGNNTGSSSSALSQAVNQATSATGISSSLNPSNVGASVTFTATVTGSNPTGTLAFTDGGNAISGCSAVALTGIGNARTAACNNSTLSQGTHSIVATYGGDAGNAGSSSSPLSQVVNAPASFNVALAGNGAVASASSTFSAAFPVSAIIDNERAGMNWGNGGGWNDATGNAWPDWIQINFNGSKTIDHVVVYTVQDNYPNPVEPTDTLTFSLYGITAFTVQGWNGAAWVTLGSVSGNNLVKRTVSFSAYTTDRIRINVTAALASYSRITEVEAWGTAAVGPLPSSTALLSSLNPSAVGASVTFTATVTGSNPTGNVAFTDSGNALVGCSAVALTGSGNVRTAACSTSALSQGTHSIVAAYAGDAGNAASSSSPLSQVVNAAGASNVALASNGAVASASSTFSAAFPVSAVNNNERAGLNWGNGGGWNDATGNAWPDWVQINFNGSKTINRVVVYTLQDNYTNPVEPTDTLTFSLYGITAFVVQGWTGSTWTTLATVSGNNLVKRTVNFSAFTTSRIRIRVTAALASFSRITEIEAWGN